MREKEFMSDRKECVIDSKPFLLWDGRSSSTDPRWEWSEQVFFVADDLLYISLGCQDVTTVAGRLE